MHHPKNQQRVSTLALGHKATSPNSTPATVERVVSIDALRGFDMFWIIGGGAIAHHLLDNDDPETWQHQLALQFDHVAWEGFRFLDLIFPLFLFLVGCVLPYSLSKYSSKPRAAYVRLFRRGFVLILLGLVYNGVFQLEFANMRYPHVLARIGIGYTIAGLLFLHTSWRTQAIVAAAILQGTGGFLSSSHRRVVKPVTIPCKETSLDTLIDCVCQESFSSRTTVTGTTREFFQPSQP